MCCGGQILAQRCIKKDISNQIFFLAVVKQFQEYVEPGSGEDGVPQRRSEEEEGVLLPLGDNTLTHNLGIPVVVVCTKVHTLLSCS